MGLLPENQPAAGVFAACDTQWRRDPMSGQLLGLDYAGVRAAAQMLDVTFTGDDFRRVRTLEHEMLTIARRRNG